MWALLTTAWVMGLFSSLHCVGMCGPLALMLPVQHLNANERFVSLFLYQAGRIITYASLGLLFGFIGRSFFVAGIQQWLSIGMGILMILLLILNYGYHKNVQPAFMNSAYQKIQKFIVRILKNNKSVFSFLYLGMANGLLPCGMLYMAIAAALSTAVLGNSILFMIFFGLGTMPAMMMISYLGTMPGLSWRRSFKKLIPLGIALVAVFLILRGMNLGIPYVSLEILMKADTPIECRQAIMK